MGGWEPATETIYEYDDTGRIVRAVTKREIEWDDQQRGLALALIHAEADQCSGCGHPLSETTDPETYGRWRARDPRQCHACAALSVKQGEYEKANVPHLRSLLWRVEKK